MLYTNPPANELEAQELVNEALSTTAHALRTAVSRSLGSSAGSIAFGRDMLLDIPVLADWHVISNRRQILINENLRRQNQKRRQFDYAVGQQILIKQTNPTKLGPRTLGPFNITRVHANGTVTIQRQHLIEERINIRRILPYRVNA